MKFWCCIAVLTVAIVSTASGQGQAINSDQTLATHPEAIDPGAVMNAQADVYIFDIPAQAGAPRSFARRLVDAIMESRRRAAEERRSARFRTIQI